MRQQFLKVYVLFIWIFKYRKHESKVVSIFIFCWSYCNITGNVDKILVNEATSYRSVLVTFEPFHKSDIQTTSDK
jgi:hypothetical protein